MTPNFPHHYQVVPNVEVLIAVFDGVDLWAYGGFVYAYYKDGAEELWNSMHHTDPTWSRRYGVLLDHPQYEEITAFARSYLALTS